MKLLYIGFCAGLCLTLPAYADEAQPLHATTVQGDAVILQPNGRWHFVDRDKAAAADKVARSFPENQGCPSGTQGGFFGFGRCIPNNDKEFNRGSLSGKSR